MSAPRDWHEANQRYLSAALAVLRERLERHAAQAKDGQAAPEPSPSPADHALAEASAVLAGSSALETLAATFGLSPFERDLLLLCAGVELESRFAALIASIQGDPRRPWPTFSLALAALPEAHWSALTPTSPLRRWRLIEVDPRGADPLTTAPLRIDERVLHYLAGVSYLDERLRGLVERIEVPDEELPPSHRAIADAVAAQWSDGDPTGPAIQLCGSDPTVKRTIAAAAGAMLGLETHAMRSSDVPASPAEREALTRLWEREAALSPSALLLDTDGAEIGPAALAFLDGLQGAVAVSTREPLRGDRRPLLRFDVDKPDASERQSLWAGALGPLAGQLDGQLDAVATQFHLGPHAIRAAGAEVRRRAVFPQGSELGDAVWEACRAQARPRLDDLAQRIRPAATWGDLVLPDAQAQTLRDIAAHVRQRFTVYERWGFAAKGARGLGISALFAGDSGTGKTMAAEVLAGALRLDLYRIDLSAVVSKYIGETEKNLRRVFDAAEDGGAVLLFDEADALFGKRSEVRDSHDRYANIEVSYLLQRMEAYRGLAILTTNMKSALDSAFLRRLRFVVQFPFPDPTQRALIWQRIFPRATPIAELDAGRLARLNVAGGSIRNIALHAAFLAADAREAVSMAHLLRAAHGEYAKLEKPLTDAEIGGWS